MSRERAGGADFDFQTFEGFSAPGTTQVPDVFFDKIMAHLSDVELRVLLYFFRRTFGFKKFSDNISISQMVSGIETRDGRTLDYGCGLSKSGVTKGLRGLLGKNLIVATRRSDPRRGNLPTNYALNMKGARYGLVETTDALQRAHPLSTSGDKGAGAPGAEPSARQGQALSTPGDTQDTVRQETDGTVTGDDRSSVRKLPTEDRPGIPSINWTAIRRTYAIPEVRFGRVLTLVELQKRVLLQGERNVGLYVQRAAEAVRDDLDDHLERQLRNAEQDFARRPPRTTRSQAFHGRWRNYCEERIEQSKAADVLSRVSARSEEIARRMAPGFSPSSDNT